MSENVHFSSDDQKFIDEAIEACQRMGEEAALLLVGSRAAGFGSSWSDLDLWILGDKTFLPIEERQRYETDGELFYEAHELWNRRDYEAHWTFYDMNDLVEQLSQWNDEKMWILLTSCVLYCSSDRIEAIKRRFSSYPTEIAERKLKWLFGKYLMSLGPLNTAARGMPVTALVVAGQVIEYLCKICCLAERKPFPYTKWLVEVAKKTYLGAKVYPFMEKAVLGIEEFVNPPAGKHFRELIPLKELRATEEIVQTGLKELGWHCDWVDNTDEAVNEALKRPTL